MRKLTALLVVALLAGSASAAWTLGKADEGLLEGQGPDGGDLAYMTLAITADVEPNTIVAEEGIHGGITGNLHQAWAFEGGLQTPTLTNINEYGGEEEEALDSHFLVLDGDLAPVESPSEDIGETYGSTTAGFGLGYGTELTGVFGVKGTEMTWENTWEFAYLVGNPGEWASVNAYFSGEGESSPVFEGNTPGVDQFPFIPEPATMSLLALGGVAALIRRKR